MHVLHVPRDTNDRRAVCGAEIGRAPKDDERVKLCVQCHMAVACVEP